MADPTILKVYALTKRFNGLVVSNNLDLEIRHGETHAVIGPNGAGKTTLINQIHGELYADSGRIIFQGRDVSKISASGRARLGIARTYQITSIFPEFSVVENVALARQVSAGHSFRFVRNAAADVKLTSVALEMIVRVGLELRANDLARNLSHGERRQLEIAMALATEPSLLLLDEPMAGMGGQDSARMMSLLSTLKQSCSILLVEHDMDAVFSLADRITVIVAGRNIATGIPDSIRADRRVREAYLGHAGGE
jgi:branched-chain amino acid transport system ATP-binding protein